MHGRLIQAVVLAGCLLAGLPCGAWGQDPFQTRAALERENGDLRLRVEIRVPDDHYLYADMFKVEVEDPVRLRPVQMPEAVLYFDPFSETEREIFPESVTALYALDGYEAERPLRVTVAYQGCNPEVCFFPQSQTWTLTAHRASPGDGPADVMGSAGDWATAAASYRVAGRGSGYMRPDAMLAFLDAAMNAEETDRSEPYPRGWTAALLILLGGLALNLTPCVLPMIPVNLAIIGAGTGSGSRRRGILMGGLYGTGIAIAYGALGLIVVLTGATFGTWNASPWFNFLIAALFIILALAMFDVIHIDLSRFLSRADRAGATGPATAFGMGVTAALLAGACVAPVVLFVIVWASDLYARGLYAGLALPFVLGLGMALPWPLAGAGLSLLPKPGAWMVRVRNLFGVAILLLAVYYGYLGARLARSAPTGVNIAGEPAGPGTGATDTLADGLQRGIEENKPVFLDFWASWCRNCVAMDKNTFRDENVKQRLESFIFVKFVAEHPSADGIREVLEYFDVRGLPTYIVLVPESI